MADSELVAALAAWYEKQGDIPTDELILRLSEVIAEASARCVSVQLLQVARVLLRVGVPLLLMQRESPSPHDP